MNIPKISKELKQIFKKRQPQKFFTKKCVEIIASGERRCPCRETVRINKTKGWDDPKPENNCPLKYTNKDFTTCLDCPAGLLWSKMWRKFEKETNTYYCPTCDNKTQHLIFCFFEGGASWNKCIKCGEIF